MGPLMFQMIFYPIRDVGVESFASKTVERHGQLKECQFLFNQANNLRICCEFSRILYQQEEV